jgi:hypothetical protein
MKKGTLMIFLLGVAIVITHPQHKNSGYASGEKPFKK